jgi:hypothetical protein
MFLVGQHITALFKDTNVLLIVWKLILHCEMHWKDGGQVCHMGDLVEYIRLLTYKIACGRYDITSEMFQTKVCMNDLLHFLSGGICLSTFFKSRGLLQSVFSFRYHICCNIRWPPFESLQSSVKYLYSIGLRLILCTNIRQPPVFLDSELGKYCYLLFK